MKTFEIQGGGKVIHGVQEGDDTVCFRADCTVFPEHVVEIRVTLSQAEELASQRRRNIPSILPDVDKALREIFITGTTPAEWDELFASSVKPVTDYPGYRACEV